MRALRFVGAAAIAIVSLASLAACTVSVAGDLDAADVNRIVSVLDSNGIAAERREQPGANGRFRVEVGRDDAERAATLLADEGLPATHEPGVLEALGSGSIVPSRTAEQARLVLGIAGELEQTLRGIDGVVSARVHLAVPRPGPLAAGDPESPSASVLLRHHGARPPIEASDVKRLVAGAVSGLAPDRVTVVDSVVPPPTNASGVVRIGPFSTSRAAAAKLRIGVAVAALLNVALVACTVGLLRRARRLRTAAAGHGESLSREPR